MTLFTFGRALACSFMATFAVSMSSALEAFYLFACFIGHSIVTGGAFTDFLAFCIGNLLAIGILAMMAVATRGSFNLLMRGMVKGTWFFTALTQYHLGRTIVSHGGDAEAHQKS